MVSNLARCPFYVEEDRRSITCEGVVAEKCIQQFKSQYDKISHKSDFCNSQYKKCTHFEAVEKKY